MDFRGRVFDVLNFREVVIVPKKTNRKPVQITEYLYDTVGHWSLDTRSKAFWWNTIINKIDRRLKASPKWKDQSIAGGKHN